MKHWAGVVAAGLGLFLMTVLGLLAAQGRLDYEGTRGVPVLSWFFAAPDKTEGPVEEDFLELGEGTAGGEFEAVDTGTDLELDLDPGSAPMLEGVAPAEGEGLFRYPRLDSGQSAADMEEQMLRIHRMEDEARRRLAIVEEREIDLGIRERDLADRERAIAQSMMEVDAAKERLDRRIAEFEQRVTLVEKDEVAGVLTFGRSLASFDPSRAAQIVMQEFESEVGRQRIVKVMTLMDSDDADRILSRVPDDKVRELLIERLDVVLEPERR